METMVGGSNISPSEDMGGNRNSETSRLVAPNNQSNTNYLNIVSNVCGILFIGILIFCCFKDGATLFSFHPILMSLGWLILMSVAVNAISPGDLATEWMPVRLRSARHWIIQLCAGTFVLMGFIVIVVNKVIHDKPHFVSYHGKFGLSSFVFMFGTMLGGVGALYSLKLKQFLAPIYIKLIHASVGLVTFTLGVITIILGLFSQWWSFGESLRYINLILVLTVMLFTLLRPSLKVYFRLRERLENLN